MSIPARVSTYSRKPLLRARQRCRDAAHDPRQPRRSDIRREPRSPFRTTLADLLGRERVAKNGETACHLKKASVVSAGHLAARRLAGSRESTGVIGMSGNGRNSQSAALQWRGVAEPSCAFASSSYIARPRCRRSAPWHRARPRRPSPRVPARQPSRRDPARVIRRPEIGPSLVPAWQ